MKLIKSILFVFLLWLFAVLPVFSQNGAAEEALYRDIRIAEGILHELFFGNDTGSMPAIRIHQTRSRRISGQYIPGYGVHFSISPDSDVYGLSRLRSVHINSTGARPQIQFYVDEDDAEGNHENRLDRFEESILDYFKTYAPLLGGLNDDEVVRVSYGERPDGAAFRIFDPEGNQQEVVSFSMWVPVADIRRYHRGQSTESEFEEKIQRYDFSGKAARATDLNIFASVLEAAINSVDIEHLELRRKPTVDYLPGLGAQYRIQINTKRPGLFLGNMDGKNFRIRLDSASSDLANNLSDSIRVIAPRIEYRSNNISDEIKEKVRNYTLEAQKYAEHAQEYARRIRIDGDSLLSFSTSSFQLDRFDADEEELAAEMEKIVGQIRDILPNYGSTLSTLQDGELLMITVNWSWAHPSSTTWPAQTELRISKADLLAGRNPEITEVDRR